MDNMQLQRWVEHISMQYFHTPFLHQATFNSRLRTTGGRYFLTTHNIEISKKYYDTFSREEVEAVIKHELCHYHLHLRKKGYRHRDKDFKDLLQQVGGARYCKPIKEDKPLYKYEIRCTQCGQKGLRKRRIDLQKYRCAKCGGKLTLQTLSFDN
ncbi:SprT family protein [Longirhabdus pacifica]|uniref:SprT family protein n=1 Tax=Longirhabdus pacifica TaxID=2305227 RepID=UPI00100919D2|nr:SprT family protein [Longirhabdus pacifica]